MKQLGFLCALALAACGDDNNGGCDGKVTAAMSNAAGTVTITGDLDEGQPILEVVDQNGDHMDYVSTNYDDSMATFTGIPAGMQTVHWILSCFNGDGQAVISGPATVTVQ